MIGDRMGFELSMAGLPRNPSKIIGRMYRFGCAHGSHDRVLVGTVRAIEISDEGGLDLYVSNPYFWGDQLISIKRSNGKWMAYVEAEEQQLTEKEVAAQFFEGDFQLF